MLFFSVKTCSQSLIVIYFIKHKTATSYFLLLMCTVSGNRKKHMAHIQIQAHHTCMILESSSKEFLQSPQYSWANWSMYLFTLAEVELIPPLLPDSSWKRGENKRNHVWSTKLTAAEQHLRQGSLAVLGSIKASAPQACLLQGLVLCNIHLSLVTCGFSGAASFTLHRRFSSCGRCPISW